MNAFFEVNPNKQKLKYLLVLLSVWTAFGVFFGTQNYVRDIYFGRSASLPGYIIGWIFCGYSWAVLTAPVIWFARRFSLSRMGWLRFLLVHLPAAAIFAMMQLAIYLFIAGILFRRADRSAGDYYGFLLANELQSSVLVYLAIVAVVTVYDRFFRAVPSPSEKSSSEEPCLPPPVETNGDANGFLRRIPVKENGKIVLVDSARVNWVESYGNYVFLHTTDRKFIYRETMTAMEKKLDPSDFVRIRRSAIVRIEQIRELHAVDNGEFEIVLADGDVLISSRRYRKNLDPVLKS